MISLSAMRVSCVALLAACMLIASVDAHGFVVKPRQRGAYKNDKVKPDMEMPKDPMMDYCPHCLNGGGKASVMEASNKDWQEYAPLKTFRKTAGLCGDPMGKNDHMIGGMYFPYDTVPLVEHYDSGSVVDFEVEIDTNHNGYFEFYLCDLDACGVTDLDDSCFKNNHCYLLERVKNAECEAGGSAMHTQCGPKDSEYPGRWYVPCRATGHVGVHVVGGSNGYMKYQLPDIECKHCVVQWYWATANSCAPGDFLGYFERYNNPFGETCASDGGGGGAHKDEMEPCGGESFPEEFWTCSDVQISAPGGSTVEVPAVPLGASPPTTTAAPAVTEAEVTTTPPTTTETVDAAVATPAPIETSTPETPVADPGTDLAPETDQGADGSCVANGAACSSDSCCEAEDFCIMIGDKSTCMKIYDLWSTVEKRRTS